MISYLRSDALIINETRFNNRLLIEERVEAVEHASRTALGIALRFIYLDDGPLNISRDKMIVAEVLLDDAERLVLRSLYNLTKGDRRGTYGPGAARVARASRYRCQECEFPDVRTLTIDHVKGRVAGTPFACLCSNCHSIKSRRDDWTGRKRQPPA